MELESQQPRSNADVTPTRSARTRRVALVVAVAAALGALVYGCPRREEPRRQPSDEPEPLAAGEREADEPQSAGGSSGGGGGRPSTPGYTAVAVENGGNITGTVRWTGARPPMEPLPVTKNPEVCGQTTPFPALHIGEGDVVSNAVAYLDGITRGRAVPQVPDDQTPTIDQQQCRYSPLVQATTVGGQIAFRNSDGTLHNVHAFWGESESWFNVAQPTRGMITRRRAERAGVARVVCDAGHTWMLSYIHVFPHPYYSVSGEDGSFRIEGVPPGTYTLKLWHAGWRVTGTSAGRPVFSPPVILTNQVTVTAGQDANVTFELSSASAS